MSKLKANYSVIETVKQSASVVDCPLSVLSVLRADPRDTTFALQTHHTMNLTSANHQGQRAAGIQVLPVNLCVLVKAAIFAKITLAQGRY